MTTISPSEEIGAYIAAHVSGMTQTGASQNVFVGGHMPDQPDAAVAVIEYGGGQPLMSMDSGNKIDQPTMQVRIRDAKYSTGIVNVFAIFSLLHGVSETVLPLGTRFHLIYALQSPIHLGRDARERHEWCINIRTFWSDPNR